MKNILITGATGHLGTTVIEHLVSKITPKQITALVRNLSKATDILTKGINVREGDYFKQESLVNAMQGIDTVLLISSSDFNDRFGQHKNVIDAAKEAGVKHVFYTGVTMKDIEQSVMKPLLESHFQTEQYIQSQGFHYTFLRNGLYMEVIPTFVGQNVLETGIFLPAGAGKVAYASRKDLGEATANILASEGHENKIYHFTAPMSYSFEEIAEALSELSGKKVPYISPESKVFEDTLKQWGLPDEVVGISSLFSMGIKNNDFDTPNSILETILGRKALDLKGFLKEIYSL
jgi:NAD(P)H dehydrogenase (quinone)